MFKLIELLRVADVPIELMVVLDPIFLPKPMFKFSQLKKQLMLKKREKLDKLQREKFQLESNDHSI